LVKAARLALVRRFFSDEAGMTAVEYGVLACVMALVVVSFASSGMSLGGLDERIGFLADVLTSPDGETVPTPVDLGR
jgi:pilus assembly protein Flp/PilA